MYISPIIIEDKQYFDINLTVDDYIKLFKNDKKNFSKLVAVYMYLGEIISEDEDQLRRQSQAWGYEQLADIANKIVAIVNSEHDSKRE